MELENNIRELFTNFQIVPLKKMQSRDQIYACFRFLILVVLVMLLLGFKYTNWFFLVALVFIFIVYYIEKRKMKENFDRDQGGIRLENYSGNSPIVERYTPTTVLSTHGKVLETQAYKPKGITSIENGEITFPSAQPNFFCNDSVSIDPPSSVAVQINQQLTGNRANPKTEIPPIVKPPTHDLDYWRDNNLIVHSAINSRGIQEDMYLSGYAESTCCDYLPEGTEYEPKYTKKTVLAGGTPLDRSLYRNNDVVEGYCSAYNSPGHNQPSGYEKGGRSIISPTPSQPRFQIPTMDPLEPPIQVPRAVSGRIGSVVGPAGVVPEPEPAPETLNPAKAGPVSPFTEGYCCKYNTPGKYQLSGYEPGGRSIVSPVPSQPAFRLPNMGMGMASAVEGYSPSKSIEHFQVQNGAPIGAIGAIGVERFTPSNQGENIREKYTPNPIPFSENEPGWVNTACGYNPDQIKVNLPSNFPAGNCQKDPRLSQFNKNLFTETVTPGVYTTSQVNENPMSNLGISFQQQFEPLDCKQTDQGLFYTQRDPRIIQPVEVIEGENVVDEARYDNIYDPRFSGYGTSYRSYLDPTTGQPRFYYSDVDTIRMPNYVVRSKIDAFDFADSYGPMREGSEFGNENTPIIRTLAQDKWVRDSMQFRNDMTERRMRKVNAEAWQQRMAPFSAKPASSRKAR